jgi:hypothetical protein
MKVSKKYISFIVFFILFFNLTSCSDPELDAAMEDYCNCIQKARYDESMRFDCIEKMDSIKAKYESQPRKMQKVLEKTNECY